MNLSSPTTNSDGDDSALFRSSLIPKRKATTSLNSKNRKQAKIFVSQSLPVGDPTINIRLCNSIKTTTPVTNESKKLSEITQNKNCTEKQVVNVDISANESFSSYFRGIKKSCNSCPLCGNSFDSDFEYSEHMKDCGKKTKLSPQELLLTLKNQKKQMRKKTKTLLECKTFAKDKSLAHEKKKDDLQIEYDLPLAIALSESLGKSEGKLSAINHKQSELLAEVHKTNKAQKQKKLTKPVLPERTLEERQRIITEKAAAVLLDEDQTENKLESNSENKLILVSDLLIKLYSGVSRLWKLGVNEGEPEWFVQPLKPYLMWNNEGGSEGSDATVLYSPKTNEFARSTGPTETCSPIPDAATPLNLNLPNSTLVEDWRKMINNDNLSDLTAVSKDGRMFHLHSLVLRVRCPILLEKDFRFVFSQFDMTTISVFLEYLYCGTLNDMKQTDVENLFDLGKKFDCRELVTVLGRLREKCELDMETVPSSLTPDLNVSEVIAESQGKSEKDVGSFFPEDRDLFDDEIVDLTQNSRGSSTSAKDEENESNVDKSYWSFIRSEKEKAEKLKRDQDKEDWIICSEDEKQIATSAERYGEMVQETLHDLEIEDTFTNLENGAVGQVQRAESNDSDTKDLDEDFVLKFRKGETCIVLSSDSDTQASKPDDGQLLEPKTSPGNGDYDVPYYDPYEDYNNFGDCQFSPVEIRSQSLLAKDTSEYGAYHLNETVKIGERCKSFAEEEGTPIRLRSSKITSFRRSSADKSRRRISDLSASRIIRKSLGLAIRSPKTTVSGGNSGRLNKRSSGKKDEVKFGKRSVALASSTPLQRKEFVPLTPNTKDVELEESVTPYPNYSRMGEALLKEHLGKYGLKKNLGKRKAEKILKHIYEELHPYFNPETGQLVKRIITDTPKNHKKGKSKISRQNKDRRSATGSKSKKNHALLTSENAAKNATWESEDNQDGRDGSVEFQDEVEDNEFGDMSDLATQTSPSSTKDLPSAMNEFLRSNPDFYKKILLYEPIWVKDLQVKLKETFKKHYKLDDLVNYLDQQCITFRTSPKNASKKKQKPDDSL